MRNLQSLGISIAHERWKITFKVILGSNMLTCLATEEEVRIEKVERPKGHLQNSVRSNLVAEVPSMVSVGGSWVGWPRLLMA
jgi:hypothetical protein